MEGIRREILGVVELGLRSVDVTSSFLLLKLKRFFSELEE